MKTNKDICFRKLSYLAIALFLPLCTVYADEIYLSNGQNATTEILDTTGCSVKMIRRGNNVSIRKNLIDKIIWKNDTIRFAGYKCEEIVIPLVRFQDTPEYKIMVALDQAEEQSLAVKENARTAFLYAPLMGNYNAEEFAGIQSKIIELFNKKGTAKIINPDEMLAAIETDKKEFDYAFFTRKYHVIINKIDGNYGSTMLGLNNPSKTIAELITTADFMLYDLSSKVLVHRKIITEKRTVWGESDYSWVGIITPEEWKKEMAKNQAERKLDRNAKAILRKMGNDLFEYLEIKE